MPDLRIQSFRLIFFLAIGISLTECDLPPHYSKEEIPETDTVYVDSSSLSAKADQSFIPPFEKLDYRVLQSLFHSDTIGKAGYIYWNPLVDELMDASEPSSLCSTRIEDVYYFSGAKNKWAFLLFVTYDDLAGKDLQTSAPIIGGAVFKRTTDDKWALHTLDKTMRRHGKTGELQPYTYKMFGKYNPALHLSKTFSATGTTSEYEYIYDLRTLKEIFAFHSGQTNEPGVKKEDPHYYKYSSTISYVEPTIKTSVYNDLKVESSGTGSDPLTDSVYVIKAVQFYRFNPLRGLYEPACE